MYLQRKVESQWIQIEKLLSQLFILNRYNNCIMIRFVAFNRIGTVIEVASWKLWIVVELLQGIFLRQVRFMLFTEMLRSINVMH